MLNNGETPVEIAEEIQMPPTLSTRTNLRGYYGSISHNAKAVYDKYMGWFNGNPAYLWPLVPTDEATEFVKCMGGSNAVLFKAQEYHTKKNLRFAATLLDKLVFATQSNPDEKDGEVAKEAKESLAAVYTELGYGAENGTWRNIYLTGAFELKNGPQKTINSMTPGSLLALNLDELFDTIAILINGPEAFTKPEIYLEQEIAIDFMIEDIKAGDMLGMNNGLGLNGKLGTGWHSRLSNVALTGHAIQYVAPPSPRSGEVSLTVWLKHQDLVKLIAEVAVGKKPNLDSFRTSGDVDAWTNIVTLVTVPNPAFNIVTP